MTHLILHYGVPFKSTVKSEEMPLSIFGRSIPMHLHNDHVVNVSNRYLFEFVHPVLDNKHYWLTFEAHSVTLASNRVLQARLLSASNLCRSGVQVCDSFCFS